MSNEERAWDERVDYLIKHRNDPPNGIVKHKICTKCGKEKPYDQFSRSPVSQRWVTHCKTCKNAYAQAYREKHRVKSERKPRIIEIKLVTCKLCGASYLAKRRFYCPACASRRYYEQRRDFKRKPIEKAKNQLYSRWYYHIHVKNNPEKMAYRREQHKFWYKFKRNKAST